MIYNVKAGVIGLDELGKVNAKLLKDHVKNLNLLAGCGRTQSELLFAKNDLSLDYVYSDEKALFENHDIDVVFIFSEIHLRPHQAIQAIESGKNVFLLNPMAMNLEDAKAVVKTAASRPSQKVSTACPVRFSPLMKTLKAAVEKKEIGSVEMISIDSSFFNSLSKENAKPSGSIFFDKIMDEIELLIWLIGDEDSVINADVNQNGSHLLCKLKTRKGKQLNILVHSQFNLQDSYLNILGSNGKIVVSKNKNTKFYIYDNTGKRNEVRIDNNHQFFYTEYIQFHDFVNSILKNEKTQLNLNESVRAMEVSLSLEKSKVLGTPIDL